MRNRTICFLMAMLLGGLAGDRFAIADDSVGLAIREYVKAFNAKDADALRNMWAENATYMDHEFAERTDGREDIMTAIEDVFTRPESVMLSGTVDHVRMVTDSVAQVEGKVMVTVGEEDPKGTQFTAILVKSDDRWVIDSMDEFEIPQPSSPDALSQLDWMIGTWRDDSGDVLVRSTVRASDNGAFLIRSFEADDEQGGKTNSTQVIAWDPRQQTIRSWTFNADGSFGDGQWSKSGDQWLIKSTQTLSDGRSASGTYVITMRSEDEFAINLVGHEIEGVPQPSLLSEVIVRREVATTDSVSASE